MMDEVDVDGSGTINYQGTFPSILTPEFLMGAVNKRKFLSSKRLKQVFDQFDQDGNGFIELDDLQKMFGNHIND